MTDFGSVELFGRGRVEVLCATQDSAAFLLYLQALDARHAATDREIFLVLDNGPCHRSKASLAALAERAKKAGVERVVFDRGGFLFHGRVKALADAAREGGLEF